MFISTSALHAGYKIMYKIILYIASYFTKRRPLIFLLTFEFEKDKRKL
jgi:hypothetical protein